MASASARLLPVPLVSLTADYLSHVTLAGDIHRTTALASVEAAPAAAAAPAHVALDESEEVEVFTCRVSAGATFDSAAELREHYHTDWYRYCLHRSTRGLPPVTEVEFDALIDGEAAIPESRAVRRHAKCPPLRPIWS